MVSSWTKPIFDGAMVVEAIASEVSCVDARSAEAVTLRLRYAEIALDGTVFAKPSPVAFAEDTLS